MTDIEKQLVVALAKAKWILKNSAPIDTGNLRYNAILFRSLGGGRWELYVDTKIAPYMPFTNEKWTAKKWNGRRNPNEGWYDRAVKDIARLITSMLPGAKLKYGRS